MYGKWNEQYRLANDIVQEDQKNDIRIVVYNSHLNLDLNGYKIHRNTRSLDSSLFVVSDGGVLELYDSSEDESGTCKFTNQAGLSYSVIRNTGGDVWIYGGNYEMEAENNFRECSVLWLESGMTTVDDGFFDSRNVDSSGTSIILNHANAIVDVPVCYVYGGKFYAKDNNIDISPNDQYLKYGVMYASVYVMGGEFYLNDVKEGNGGFSYCNNGWGRVIVAEGTIPCYSLNVKYDVNYIPHVIKKQEYISIDHYGQDYYHVSSPPVIIGDGLVREERIFGKCLREDLKFYCTEIMKKNYIYELYGKMMEEIIRTPDTIEVGTYTNQSPIIYLDGISEGDTVKWYMSSDYDGENTIWEEVKEFRNVTDGWRYSARPKEETTIYIRSVVTHKDGSLTEDVVAVHYEKLEKILQGKPLIYMNNPHYGNNVYAGVFDAPEWQDKSTYTYEWKLDGIVVGESEKFSIDQESYIGKRLSCTIRSTEYEGVLVTPEVTVRKAINYEQPVFPKAYYDAASRSITLTNLCPDQEYLFTTKENLSDLNDSDWAYAKKPEDETGTWKLSYVDLEDSEGETIYIYTRYKENATQRVGEKAAAVPLMLSDQVYMKDLNFIDSVNGTIYIPFTRAGEQVKLTYSLDPINANQWTNFTWVKCNWPVKLLAPVDAVTPGSGNEGMILLELVSTGVTDLTAYTSTGTLVKRVRVVVYDPLDPAIGSANVVCPIPDKTIEAGTVFRAEIPEMIPEPPESLEMSWYFTRSTQNGLERFTECEAASIDSETGEITAHAPGKVNVSLMKPSENGYYDLDTFELTVVEYGGIISIDRIILSKTKVTIQEKETAYLEAAVSPINASNQDQIWSSSDESVVKVDQRRKIQGISEGTAKITVTIDYKTASCDVTVTKGVLHSGGTGMIENPFTDVPSGSWYEKAVLWAVQNDITAGTSDTTFSPDAKCTRAQIVTFLYRCTER